MTWTTDGSPELRVDQETVTCTRRPSGGCCNALWSDGASEQDETSGEQLYWKFHFSKLEHNGAFVGITNSEKFGKGYALKCLAYGGNLSDGSGALVLEFGPRFSSGDTVGMLVNYQDNELLVYYNYNERNLGLAFRVPVSELRDAKPVVHFSAPGSVTCTRARPPPDIRTRTPEIFESIYGPWRMISFTRNGASVPTPVQPTIAITRSLDCSDDLVVTGSVINHMAWNLTKTTDEGRWQGSTPRTTLMMGPPDEMTLEDIVAQLFASTCTINIVENDHHRHLVCTAAANNLRATFERYDPSPSPYSGNPFAR